LFSSTEKFLTKRTFTLVTQQALFRIKYKIKDKKMKKIYNRNITEYINSISGKLDILVKKLINNLKKI